MDVYTLLLKIFPNAVRDGNVVINHFQVGEVDQVVYFFPGNDNDLIISSPYARKADVTDHAKRVAIETYLSREGLILVEVDGGLLTCGLAVDLASVSLESLTDAVAKVTVASDAADKMMDGSDYF